MSFMSFKSPTDFGPQGPLGNALLHKFALATEGLNPPHTYVPWIVIDGDSSEVTLCREIILNMLLFRQLIEFSTLQDMQARARDDLKKVICERIPQSKLCGGGWWSRHWMSRMIPLVRNVKWQ